ncbi:hypothetical protein [Winogradskyella sp.]|uniref:hypothetical protein n=1 Tax=Winogradskyella sp. TaxID=1883156 RepID=UPI00262C0BAB|nr:hypothetical protein [Winogradskyella sp.]
MKKLILQFILLFLFTIISNAQNQLDSLWKEIAFAKKSSCLLGTQYSFERKGERFKQTIFNKAPWQLFIDNHTAITTPFLLEKLADTTKTSVHICPFMVASNGELAVYALQQTHKINWYDFEIFSNYANRDITSGTDNHQVWLQKILSDDSERKKLESLFRKLLD